MEDGVPRRDFWGTVSFPLSPALCCDASRGVQDMQGSKETRTMCAATGRGSGQLYPPHKQLAIVSRDWMLVKVGAQARRLVEDVQRRRLSSHTLHSAAVCKCISCLWMDPAARLWGSRRRPTSAGRVLLGGRRRCRCVSDACCPVPPPCPCPLLACEQYWDPPVQHLWGTYTNPIEAA